MTEIHWTVPAAHPAFAGHFPGRPILPGVVLIDQAMRLAAGVLGPDVAIRGLANAKFFHTVTPGTHLLFRYPPATATALRFDILADEQIVASGSFTLGAGS
jgi:3-hydroxymyristoyl/3-hydroxydecanoyl-(acyl carrier protein) dehydratase